MKEQLFTLDISRNRKIYGVVNRPDKESSKTILIVPGLGCDKSSHPYPMAAMYFVEHGFNVIRFDFCSGEPGGQNVLDCTVLSMTEDLKEIVTGLALETQDLYMIGHSYGGWIIMMANLPQVKAVSLWDPSYHQEDRSWAIGIEDDYGDRVCVRWGNAYMFSKNMIAAQKTEGTWEKHRDLGRNARFPVQVIHAKEGGLYKKGESYHTYHPGPRDYLLLPGATHCFEELALLPTLFERTRRWFGT